MLILLILTLLSMMMAIRALLIVTGMYKDPILQSFEHYGAEEIFSPLVSLVLWTLLLLYVSMYWFMPPGMMLAIGIFGVLPLTWFREPFENLLSKQHVLFRRLPRWYYELVKRTDREERRKLAYNWLRLPVRTRMLYNAQDAYFRQWVDQMLMTIGS